MGFDDLLAMSVEQHRSLRRCGGSDDVVAKDEVRVRQRARMHTDRDVTQQPVGAQRLERAT